VPVFTDVNLSTNATRGGVVLETGASVSPDLHGTRVQFVFAPPTPVIRYPNYDPDCNVPVWWNKDATVTQYQCERWTKASNTWTVLHSGPPADFNCFTTDCNWGDMKLVPDTNYRWRVMASNGAGSSAYGTLNYDCNVILSNCYPADTNAAQWRALGRPDCWCAFKGAGLGPRGGGYQCDGDADAVASAPPDSFRVFGGDLALVQAGWAKKRELMTADPNVTTSIHINALCADFDHKASAPPDSFRVYGTDLGILIGNWKKHNSSWTGTDKLPGNCPR
jgi:hypothetical protein